MIRKTLLFILFVFLLIISCEKENPENKENTKPVANAGDDKTVKVGQIIKLDGSKSSDEDGDKLSYIWEIISKPNSSVESLSSNTLAMPVLKPDVIGEYKITLIVNDGTDDSDKDTTIISAVGDLDTVNNNGNALPIANAGEDLTMFSGDTAFLDGSKSYDPEGNALTYYWTVKSQPDNGDGAFSDEIEADPWFLPNRTGTYLIELVVNDGKYSSKPDSLIINVEFKLKIDLISNYNLNSYTNIAGMAIDGDYAYITHNNEAEPHLNTKGGFIILDISNNSDIKKVSELNFSGDGKLPGHIAYKDDYIYFTGDVNGISCYNVSDKTNPVFSNTYVCFSLSVFIQENYLYTSIADNGGLLILDISNPPEMKYVGTGNTNGSNAAIMVKDNYAYVVNTGDLIDPDKRHTLRIFDITDKSNPIIAGTYDNPYWVHEIFVKDNYVFLGCNDLGVEIIDVSVKTNPKLVTQIQNYPGPIPLFAYDDLLFFNSESGMQIFNISNISNPVKYGSHASYNGSLYVEEGFIYEVNRANGFNVFSYEYKE